MVQNQYTYKNIVYYQKNTSNKSFLDMHYYLKNSGRKNNKFFLVLYDPDLMGINPRDPRLNKQMKMKVLKECTVNFFYFIREVVRIPDQGGAIGGGKQYQLHRGNLAMNFGFIMNWCMFVEFPRQNGKTMAAIAWYLYCYQFGTTNSEFMFMNKSYKDSKMNLERLKEVRNALPDYLQMKDPIIMADGTKSKGKDNSEVLIHHINKNTIKTMASATSIAKANSLGRGCTQPFQWYDEHAFIPHIDLIYKSATPAYKTASMNARANKKPYGILITTTPGDLTTASGAASNEVRKDATPFTEHFYDKSFDELNTILSTNTKSSFVYIRYTYQQLGRSEQWFKDLCVEMLRDWSAIRREVLLEWSAASDNSPFTKEDLNRVKQWIAKEPLHVVFIRGYMINIYSQMDPNYSMYKFPPLIGVDVSGGYMKDSSAITIVDSRDTRVIGDMNHNSISPNDLAAVIFDLVTIYMPRAIVNIERNGGFGASVLSKLVKTRIQPNLYYEIKERVLEERVNGGSIRKLKSNVKVYGFDNTKNSRNTLIDILRNRMEYHKDKFISPILFSELEGLVMTKEGRVEHSTQSHDDQVFSYLMALYMWYYGKNMSNWGLDKRELKTDEELDEIVNDDIMYNEYNIMKDLGFEGNEEVQKQLKAIDDKSILYEEWVNRENAKDRQALHDLIRTNPVALEAYARQNALDAKEVQRDIGSGKYIIPASIFSAVGDDNQ